MTKTHSGVTNKQAQTPQPLIKETLETHEKKSGDSIKNCEILFFSRSRLNKPLFHPGKSLLKNHHLFSMVGEMVQNSQSLYSFTFNALIDIHEYIYSHSTTEFTFKKYIYSHLPVYFLFTIIFAHIYEMSSFTFNELYPFTFTIEISIQHFLRISFAHRLV